MMHLSCSFSKLEGILLAAQPRDRLSLFHFLVRIPSIHCTDKSSIRSGLDVFSAIWACYFHPSYYSHFYCFKIITGEDLIFSKFWCLEFIVRSKNWVLLMISKQILPIKDFKINLCFSNLKYRPNFSGNRLKMLASPTFECFHLLELYHKCFQSLQLMLTFAKPLAHYPPYQD